MRIATRMALALGIAAALLYGGYGAHSLRKERRELETAVQRETHLLGRSLQVAIENSLRDRQREDIQETLARLELIAPSVDLLILAPDRTPEAWSTGAVLSDAAGAMVDTAMQGRSDLLRFLPLGDPTELVVAMPLQSDEGELIGGLVVVRPIDDMHQDLAVTAQGIGVSWVMFVVLTAAVSLSLGTVYVGRPIRQGVAAMQQVAAGDLDIHLADKWGGEAGELARALNQMVTQLREARARLDRESDQKRRLQRALQDADKLVTIGQLAASLAHEIGSPLQVLNGRARVMSRHPHDAAKVRRNAEIIIQQTERITGVVAQLLDLARRRPSQVAPLALPPIVHQIVDLLAFEARRLEVTLELVCSPKVGEIVADGDQLQQVVLNLARNALRAAPPGSRVEVALEPSMITRHGELPPLPAVRIAVRDEGPFIPEALRERVFEPFFTTRADEGGTGLGLAVVKSIVDGHGGQVRVVGSPGGGTEFQADLPVAGPDEADA